MTKKYYEQLEVEIIVAEQCDVITASNDNDGQWMWEVFSE